MTQFPDRRYLDGVGTGHLSKSIVVEGECPALQAWPRDPLAGQVTAPAFGGEGHRAGVHASAGRAGCDQFGGAAENVGVMLRPQPVVAGSQLFPKQGGVVGIVVAAFTRVALADPE